MKIIFDLAFINLKRPIYKNKNAENYNNRQINKQPAHIGLTI